MAFFVQETGYVPWLNSVKSELSAEVVMNLKDTPREWNASIYDTLPLPHERWGNRLIESMDLKGNETVIDLGAGTGRDALQILRRLPRGRVIAVDANQAMLSRLEYRLAAAAQAFDDPGLPVRCTVLCADLARPLPLKSPVDVAFSVATLHWVPDHARLLKRIARHLLPDGLLVAEMGGPGNLAGIDAALRAEALPTILGKGHFPSADETVQRLIKAGFQVIDVNTQVEPVVLPSHVDLEKYLRVVVLSRVLETIPSDTHTAVVARVAKRIEGEPLRYVRLQLRAQKSDARMPSSLRKRDII